MYVPTNQEKIVVFCDYIKRSFFKLLLLSVTLLPSWGSVWWVVSALDEAVSCPSFVYQGVMTQTRCRWTIKWESKLFPIWSGPTSSGCGLRIPHIPNKRKDRYGNVSKPSICRIYLTSRQCLPWLCSMNSLKPVIESEHTRVEAWNEVLWADRKKPCTGKAMKKVGGLNGFKWRRCIRGVEVRYGQHF